MLSAPKTSPVKISTTAHHNLSSRWRLFSHLGFVQLSFVHSFDFFNSTFIDGWKTCLFHTQNLITQFRKWSNHNQLDWKLYGMDSYRRISRRRRSSSP
jgi:hypothetical protein